MTGPDGDEGRVMAAVGALAQALLDLLKEHAPELDACAPFQEPIVMIALGRIVGGGLMAAPPEAREMLNDFFVRGLHEARDAAALRAAQGPPS